jgi:hypothetical protein
VAQPGNPQALNRYAYVSNNPLRYIDPSGHLCFEVGTKVICSADDDSNMYWWPDRSSEEDRDPPAPWKLDEGYDPDIGGIEPWGDLTGNQEWREVMSSQVWGWMCAAGGWWGSGCPGAWDLAAWLLQQEGGKLLRDHPYDDIYNKGGGANGTMLMSMMINYLFADGDISITDLSFFTSFYNPSRDHIFDQADWDIIQTKPLDVVYNELKQYWGKTTEPFIHDGVYVTHWWEPWEEDFNYNIYHTVYSPRTGQVILYFGP